MKHAAAVIATKPHVESPKSGIDHATRKDISGALGDILSSAYSLLVKTHVHHWNIVGPLFQQLHTMLEEQYETLFKSTDLYAERIRALGFPAPIPHVSVEQEARTMSAEQIVDDLLGDHETCVRAMRDTAIEAEGMGDIVTHDLLVAQMAWHEKTLWMLRAVVAKA
ncbi:hypothetical protein CCR94_15750 [Rhodoblastus sphagnicola]|uniref:Ferritin/DPS domain-containing protein n=1 Tax=Rhodoblastus sphagnicola TaxID=333368 RepID=A0A2S6N3W0_9HYPH|nr:DNA starvation/stationary phase protection protein [Rhodoblastus sphagnicola]MBB4198933.1 starvation-inducible DNA-binding protein [Rhodoblastus sphagnicola]PPQ29292.1 hypothetical protein CCR94_15750 [Rhodoblastus sphagnicola]